MIELLIVIAIIGILTATVTPKLLKEIRKATVAKVQNNLGVIRSRLSLDETLSDKFPNLSKDDNLSLLEAYRIEPTPPFTDENGNSYMETSKIVNSRTNEGGWYYIRKSGEIYANLPNGAYTKDQKYEIWSEEVIDNSGDGNGGGDNGSSDWDNIDAPKTKSSSVHTGSGGGFYQKPWGSGNYVTSINPGVGYLGINGAKLNGNYQVYIDGKLIESNSGTPSSDGQGISIPSYDINVTPNNAKLLRIAFEYTDKDGQVQIIYNDTELSKVN